MTILQGRCFRTESPNAAEHASPRPTRSLRHLRGRPTARRVRREAGSPAAVKEIVEGRGSGRRALREAQSQGAGPWLEKHDFGAGLWPGVGGAPAARRAGILLFLLARLLPEELSANGRAALPDRGREEAEPSAQAGPCAVGLSPATSAGGHCLVVLACGPVPARTGGLPLPWAGTHRCGAGSSGPLCALLLGLYVAPFGRSGMEIAARPQRCTWTSCSCWTASPT